MNFPPIGQKNPNSKFAGREWRDLTVGELVTDAEVVWADMNTSVEDACKVRSDGPLSEIQGDVQ
jgi:hypothetical protein